MYTYTQVTTNFIYNIILNWAAISGYFLLPIMRRLFNIFVDPYSLNIFFFSSELLYIYRKLDFLELVKRIVKMTYTTVGFWRLGPPKIPLETKEGVVGKFSLQRSDNALFVSSQFSLLSAIFSSPRPSFLSIACSCS